MAAMAKNDKIPPRPWRTISGDDPEDPSRCNGIVDADGNSVVVTDSGFYPPNMKTAEWIVRLVNRFS